MRGGVGGSAGERGGEGAGESVGDSGSGTAGLILSFALAGGDSAAVPAAAAAA